MIEYIKGDITNEISGLILHGVNCQGAFRSGLAGAIRNKWVVVFEEYERKVDQTPDKTMLLGELQIILVDYNLIVGNIFSQMYYGRDAKKYADPSAIEVGLIKAIIYAKKHSLKIKTVKLGCGLGGLSWENEIQPIFEKISDTYNVDIMVFEP